VKVIAFATPLAEDSYRILTTIMVFLLNFFQRGMLLAMGAASPDLVRKVGVSLADLSEAELVARYPVMAAVTVLLLVLGLVCDLYLLLHLGKRLKPSTTGTVEPFLRIEPKPWTIQDLLFAMGVLILVFVGGNNLLALGLKLAHVDGISVMPWLLALETVLRIGILIGFIEFFRRRRIDWQWAIGLRQTTAVRAGTWGAVYFLAILPPLAVVFAVYDKLCQLVGLHKTMQPMADLLVTSDSSVVVVLTVILAVVVAPVFEEFFFRGFAYPALKQRWGTWKALAIVSLVFALAHWHVPSLGPLFALAIGLGLAYELTGSLLAPIIMHALFNVTNIAMLLYVRAHP
jgi:uncharacterized protein